MLVLRIGRRRWALRLSLLLWTIVAVLAGQSVHASATPASVRPAGEKQRVSARYFVDFHARSRPSISGHIFIVYGKQNAKGGYAETRIAGFSPNSDSTWLAYVLPMPGLLGRGDDDLKEASIIVYRRYLNAAEFNRLNAQMRRAKASRPIWHFLFANCNDFATDVARSLGLYRPPSLLPPVIYVTLLEALNGKQKHPSGRRH